MAFTYTGVDKRLIQDGATSKEWVLGVDTRKRGLPDVLNEQTTHSAAGSQD